MTQTTTSRGRISDVQTCLAHPHRRHALVCLRDADGPVELADLAESVTERYDDSPGDDLEDRTVTDVRISLYHAHVPKLADAALVQYDREQRLVELAGQPDDLGLEFA